MFPAASLDSVAVLHSLFPNSDIDKLIFQNPFLQQQVGPSSFPQIPSIPVANLSSLASGTKHDGLQSTEAILRPPGCYAPAVIWPEEDTFKPFDEMSVSTGYSRAHTPTDTVEDEPPFEMGKISTKNYFPTHFMRGTVISLRNGSEKITENLNSDDFIAAASFTNDASVEMCMVLELSLTKDFLEVKMLVLSKNKETMLTVPKEHPFFIVGKGWGSFDPIGSFKNFGHTPVQMETGDIIIVLLMEKSLFDSYQLETSIAKANEECERKFKLFDKVKDIHLETGRRSAPPLGFIPKSRRRRTWSEVCPILL